jgi:hypothetical protein
MDSNETEELRVALVSACGLAPTSTTPADAETLLHELARRVDYLLRHDADKLMYYLYSLDVSEDEVAKAFAADTAEEPAQTIARAILDREAQRLRTRKMYEQQSRSGPDPLDPREIDPHAKREVPE